MGTETGIDLPGEATGISTSIENMDPVSDGGKILDLAFGQFDTYTTLQLAQYAATVANGGKDCSLTSLTESTTMMKQAD